MVHAHRLGGALPAAEALHECGVHGAMNRSAHLNAGQRARAFRAALLATTALTACVIAAAPAGAADWTGAIGDWFDPANWNSGVPTSGDDAYINNGGTAEIGADGAAASNVWIGQNAGHSGAVEVTGPDAELTASGGVYIGHSGSGRLDISGGGVVNGGVGTTIGAASTSDGSVTVDGDGSAFNNSGLTVGNDGEGTLDITNGGYVFSTSSILGSRSTGNGTVNISGAGSLWESLYSLYVGYEGSASLDITDGGEMSVSEVALIGFLAGSTGSVAVDGENSVLNADWGMYVGVDGEGTLEVTNGGYVSSSASYIGYGATGRGGATIDGMGSHWETFNTIYVGYDGEGTLDITNGGSAGASNIYIGYQPDGIGSVTVDGVGSELNLSDRVLVGFLGTGTLDITNGGMVSSARAYLGAMDGASGAAVVNGPGSTWTITDSLFLGDYGAGTLDISGGGEVNGSSIFAGNFSSGSGTIRVDGAGSSLTMEGTVYVGADGDGELTIANGATAELGLLRIAQYANSTGVVNIGAAAGDAAVAAGLLDVSLIIFGDGTGEIVFNHTDTDYLLASSISGTGSLHVLSGSTTLSGNSYGFAGTTNVEGGALIVNGLLGGSLDVANARLGGSGSVGTTVLGSGAVIAPGNSAGTLTVDGDLTFHADSTYEVEVDTSSNTSDLIHVTGTAWLNGASVAHVGSCGCYPWYMTRTILTANGGIDGTFGSIASDFAFLTPDLFYDANNVRMTLLRNDVDFAEVTTTLNQKGVASAASGLGPGNPIYDEILMMTEEEARAAFDALSGEAYASAGSAAFNAAQQLRDLLQMRLQMFSGAKVALAGFVPAAGDRLMADAPAVWGQVFGSEGTSDATATSAKLNRRSTGFIGGADKGVGEDARVGFALGYSRSNFDVSSLFSSGGSDNFHLMGYAGTKLGAVDLGATLGYSYGRADAERTVVVGGLTENLSADYDSHTFQASVEAGTDFDMGPVVLTPFAGLAVTHVETGSFTETGGSSALSFASSSNTTGLSTLGLRVSRETGGVTLAGSAAWRHAFGDVEPVSRAAFASASASPFSVRGTAVSEDAIALEAGIGLRLDQGTRLTFGYSGEYASGSRDNGLKAELRVEF